MDALWPPTSAAGLITTTALATAVLVSVSGAVLWPRRPRVLPSPLHTTLPRTSKAELQSLVYQPDQFPGARDVPSPYGSIRVYEFGPEDGPKVLFVHGISTSCVALSRLAHGLADDRGCRVMLFDLFGRGFSDGVGDLPHDDRLYVSQMLIALASSPLAWTGTGRLRVVGYSLGGGIAVHFANAFPDLVESLVLLAPAGLIRPESFGVISRFFFSSGLVPEGILAVLTRRRLQQPIASSRQPKKPTTTAAAVADAVMSPPPIEAAAAEASDPPPGQPVTPFERRVLEYVRWMVIHHVGFVPAFMSSIRFAPLTHQHDSWKLLSRRSKGSTAVLLAEGDEIIDVEDYSRDALPLIGGESHVLWKVFPGGHDFVMTHANLILSTLDEFWGSKA